MTFIESSRKHWTYYPVLFFYTPPIYLLTPEVILLKPLRPDKSGTHRVVYESNKKKILKTQTVCGICGKPVDKSLKYPDPLSPCIDHIIPVSKGGHPSDINNLQLAHWTCNRQKSDKLSTQDTKTKQITSNRNLAWSLDWTKYKHD